MTKDTFMGKGIYPGRRQSRVPQGAKVYPIKPGVARLSLGPFKDAMGLMREMLQLPDELYSNFYRKLIDNYADFVQFIPERADFPSHSMLGNSLKRSYEVTKKFLTLLQVTHGQGFHQTEYGARVVFAVFSSSLLFRVAKVFSDKQVFICDQTGKIVSQWLYYSNPMSRYGRYFKYRMTPNLSDEVVTNMTIVLAKQLMPTLAFSWITEDQKVLEAWFRALNILDALFGLHQMELNVEALMRASALQLGHEDDDFVPSDTLIGEAFWEWLIDHVNGLGSDTSLVDDGVGLVDGELLFDVDRLVDRYAKSHRVDRDVVAAQFREIGVAQSRGGDFLYREVRAKSQAPSGIGLTGMYAQQSRQVDKMDAKRFVGVDASIATTYFKNYNGMSNDENLGLGKLEKGIYARLVSMFLGNLSGGIDLINNPGGGL